MPSEEKWIIRKADGQQLQSFAIDPVQIVVGWLRPDAPGKTKEGKKGPLTLRDKTRALALLAALAANLPSEFMGSEVVSLSINDRQIPKVTT